MDKELIATELKSLLDCGTKINFSTALLHLSIYYTMNILYLLDHCSCNLN